MKLSVMQTPPSVAAASKPSFTPQAPHSASPLPVGTKSGVQPIAALNPYDTNVSVGQKRVNCQATQRALHHCQQQQCVCQQVACLLY
jgi:hypothetical protein